MATLPQSRFLTFPLLLLAFAFAGGIVVEHYAKLQSRLSFTIAIAIAALLSVSSAALASRKRLSASLCVVAAFLSTGFLLGMIDEQPPAPNRLARLYDQGAIAAGDAVEVTGVVQGEPEPAPLSFYLTLRAEAIRETRDERAVSGTVLLLAHTSEQQVRQEYEALELRHGARIRVLTTLDRDESFRNPGVMPFTEYLERKGYDATGVIKSPLLIERLDDERVFLPLAWLYEWRAYLEHEFSTHFSPETAGVLDAALLGNRYNVSRTSADRFRAGGTFHVLVIAGLHISFIGGLAFVLARWFTKRRLFQFLLSATFLWAYTIAVGAHMPVVRAALMFTLVVFAPIVWRRANSLNVIGGAMLALLVWRPSDLFDPSFQLTFLSVLAIVGFAVPLIDKMRQVGSWRPTMVTPYPPNCANWFRSFSEALFWSDRVWRAEMKASNINYRLFKTSWAARFERWHLQRLLRYTVAAIVVSASVQIGMLPLLVLYFHRISFAALVMNIFVGALMVALSFVALAAIALAHLSGWIAAPLIAFAEKIDWTMIHSVDPFAKLGIAAIRLPHYHGWPALVYGLYFLPLSFLAFALVKWNPFRIDLSAKRPAMLSPKFLSGTAIAFAALFTIIVLHPFSASRPDGKLHVDFLDVGQGDSALLTAPDGTTLLIDGGGRPNIDWNNSERADMDEPFERDTRTIGEGVVSEYLWARGLDRVDYVLATHADSDHIDGLNDVARNFRVRGAIVARAPSDDPEFARFASSMRDAGVPIEKIGSGDVIRIGSLSCEVLWPPPATNLDAPSRNNDSIVLRVRFGETSFLFTGDLEKEGEALVLQIAKDLRSDIVKVAHHGSRTSSIPPFIAVAEPSLAVISVGRTSIFGHPAKEVVERWRASGAEVMTTGAKGTISVVSDGRTFSVSTFVK